MLIGGIALGLIAGFLAGGSFANLVENTKRLRWLAILILGAIVRFGTEIALNLRLPAADALRLDTSEMTTTNTSQSSRPSHAKT